MNNFKSDQSAMIPASIPVVTCGDTERHAAKMPSAMAPEYDGTKILPRLDSVATRVDHRFLVVVYAGFDLPATLRELPRILAADSPDRSSLHSQIASNDFSRRPLAVLIGGGYSDEAFDALRKACIAGFKGTLEGPHVVWLRAMRSPPEVRSSSDYPNLVVSRAKAKLAELEIGKEAGLRCGLDGKQTGDVFLF